MSPSLVHQPDPELDLVMERVIDVPPALVWAAWTQPERRSDPRGIGLQLSMSAASRSACS